MIGPDIIDDFRNELARRITKRAAVPPLIPLAVSPWVAMSLMQKAVRRARVDLALAAAATLLVNSPERLWRRLGGIAFEEIGPADPCMVGVAVAALGGKRVRADLGGEWCVASLLVTMMASARKCRAADDLLMGIELHRSLAEARQAYPALSIHQLRRTALAPEALLYERGLALWLMLGTDRYQAPYLAPYRGEPALAFDLLDELGTPPTMIAIAREGFRKLRSPLCLFSGLLMADADLGELARFRTEDDVLPHEEPAGPVPCWAVDLYTREGRSALDKLLQTDAPTARWARHHLTARERISVLGSLVFRIEGGLLTRRIQWPLANELRRRFDLECLRPEWGSPAELLAMVLADLPLLNKIRIGEAGHAA